MSIFDAKNEEDVYAFQVRRMRSMKGYPKGEDDELIRVARQYAPAILSMCDAVSQLIEECSTCPSCADLKAALLARKPDESPEWLRGPRPAGAGDWNSFCATNERIMENARKKENEQTIKDKAVRDYLHIRDFSHIDFPQRWWAERELGYPLEPVQNSDVEHWLASLSPSESPMVVLADKRQRVGESLGDMGFERPGGAMRGGLRSVAAITSENERRAKA